MLRRKLCCLRRAEDGVVALEAMLSIILLFVAFYCMWGAALVVYNQSRLNTAAQLSAQSAVVIFDRSTYRGIDPDGLYARALNRAQKVAYSVYNENTCGMLPNQFTGEVPESGCGGPVGVKPENYEISIQCSAALTAGYSTNNCHSGGIANAQALRVRVRAETVSPFDLLSPFAGFGANHETRPQMLRTTADAYSFASEGKIR